MKEINRIGAQGDVLFLRAEAIPTDAVRVSPENGRLLVAHSETGHHHAVEASPGIEMFMDPKNPLRAWLKVPPSVGADVVHHRPWDTHETMRLLSDGTGETIWEIRRQRERSPEGWRRVAD